MAHRPSKTVKIAGHLVAKRVRLIVRPQELLSCYSRYGCALVSRFSCYGWVKYGLSNDLPFAHVVPARLDGDEPAVFDQNFGRVDCSLPVPQGVGSVDTNISPSDGGFGPMLEPVEQFLCGEGFPRLFARLFDRWRPSLTQSFKQARHCRRPFSLPRLPRSTRAVRCLCR